MKSWIPYAISAGICALAVPIIIWLLKSKFKKNSLYSYNHSRCLSGLRMFDL